jgi:hypothetical protein
MKTKPSDLFEGVNSSIFQTYKEAVRADNSPEEIIKWCEDEIKEYEKLIELVKKNTK